LAGSVSFSVTLTSRTKGERCSAFRSKMLVSKAVSPAAPAATTPISAK
jgi:hypothetical protein